MTHLFYEMAFTSIIFVNVILPVTPDLFLFVLKLIILPFCLINVPECINKFSSFLYF